MRGIRPAFHPLRHVAAHVVKAQIVRPIAANGSGVTMGVAVVHDALADVGTGGYILVRGDDGSGGQCVYDDDLLLNATNDECRIQGYYGDENEKKSPLRIGKLLKKR